MSKMLKNTSSRVRRAMMSLAAFTVVACHGGDDRHDGLATKKQEITTITECRRVELNASRVYSPSRWTDASMTVSPAISFTLPREVLVIKGAAWHQWVELQLQRSGDLAWISCRYDGDFHADRYDFNSCSDGTRAGDPISAVAFKLHIQKGDHKDPAGETVVRLLLEDYSCVSCDDGNPCTFDEKTSAGCRHTTLPANADCSDGNPCDGAEQCNAVGECVKGSPPVIDDGLVCTVDSCEPSTGVRHVPVADGTSCDDGNSSTLGDVCTAGVCAGVDRCVGVTCTAKDGCHLVGDCDHATGICSDPVAPDGTACSDGDGCTRTDTCSAGACIGGERVTCAAKDQCHVAGVCDIASGMCSEPAKADGTTCDDGNAATVRDVCTAGMCAGVDHCIGVTCAASDACHLAGVCDHATGACSHPVAPDGNPCSDGNACTQTDTCVSGACSGSNPVNCAAKDQCHLAGVCDTSTGSCSEPTKADGTSCTDGNADTVGDVCSAGVCAGVDHCIGVTCVAKDQCHVAGVCNHATGVCTDPPAANGTACDDGNGCTRTDSCNAGVCTGSNPLTCAAKDQCHVAGVCDTSTGTCSDPTKTDGTSCNDGNADTVGDVCTAGVCAGVDHCIGVTCTAKDQCHVVGTCDHATGVCSDPAAADGTACNDSNACTQTDKCVAGTCTGSNPVTCTAKDQCHVAGTCDTTSGTCSDPAKTDGTSCNDGNADTVGDVCTAGVCAGVDHCIGVTCTAKDACHLVGVCDHATGICSDPVAADGSTCDDGNGCTRTDKCVAGVCTGSNPVTCAAKDQCHTAGVCDPATGACSDPVVADGTKCTDGNECTQADTCIAGACTGGEGVTCVAKDQCHMAGVCDPTSGHCSHPVAADGTSCDDGDSCTQTDTCASGACNGANPVTCTASDACHLAGVCDKATGFCSNPAAPDSATCKDGKVVESNAPPVVDAGADRAVTPGSVTLTGTATDDGKPAPLTLAWLQLSGPMVVPIADNTQASIVVELPVEGVYVFKLKASDSQLVTADDVAITVKKPGSGTTYSPGAADGTATSLARDGTQIKLEAATWRLNFIWVPVTSRGTIAKIDTDTGKVLGEYWTAPNLQPRGPSRTAVDRNGAVWVANREGHSVTRIGHKDAGQCVDRNGNGVIDTSTGQHDIRAWSNTGAADSPGGVSTAQDECILNYTLVAASGARHVSVDANNDVWVSGTEFPGRMFDLLDGKTGAIKRRESSVTFGGFGGLIDERGVLWSARPLLRWDPALSLSGANGTNWKGYSGDTYGLCRDSQGNVWATSAGTTTVSKRAPSGELLATFSHALPTAKNCVADRNDDIWIAWGEDSSAKVAHLKNDGTLVGSVAAGAGASAMSLDARGKVWVANCVGRTVSRIDPAAGSVGSDGVTPLGAVDLTTVDLSGNPYGYDNMTGSISATGPGSGSWTAVFNSDVATSKWGQVQWSSWICGDAKVTIKAASSVDGTTFGADAIAQNGVPFTIADGRYLRVIASFERSSKGESPMLSDVTVATRDRPLTPKPNAAPLVNAGKGFTIALPNRGRLIGSVCDDGLPSGVITSTWSKVSGPGTVTFVSGNAESTEVIFGAAGTYVLRLTGSDTAQSSTSDVTVTVNEQNLAPTVDAGPNRTVTLPEAITLSGTATDDGRPIGGSLAITWSKVSGPGTVTLGTPNALTTTASFSVAGSYVLRLSASDSLLTTSADVTVVASSPPTINAAPVARAGSNLTIELGSTATLSGLVTDDGLPTGSAIAQQWTQVSGPGTTTFADASAASTTATFSAAGLYLLRLTASDGELTGFSEAAVTVLAPPDPDAGSDAGADPAPLGNKPPTVLAGPNLAITLPTATVTLNGTVTDDGLPGGSTLTKQWSKVSGPGAVTFGDATSASTTATLSVAGTYVLRLTASDTQFTVGADVQVTVRAAISGNKAPIVSAGDSQNLTLPVRTVALVGTVSDDGNPIGAIVTMQWSLASGPATVTFSAPTALSTTATFASAGTYVLRLTANDTQLSGSGDVVVTVQAAPAPNAAPTIAVGAPQTITYPATTTATLHATITDDGLPIGGSLQTQWLQASGPAVATIGGEAGNVATFTALGEYTFRVYAFDGESMSSAVAKVSVVAPTVPNAAPVVSAGAPQTIMLPSKALLSATVRDDGLPATSTLTLVWSRVSGPGTATFGTPTSAATEVEFGVAGTYVLRLTANDGALTTSSYVTVTVLPVNLAPVVYAGAPQTLAYPTMIAVVAGTVTDDALPAGASVTSLWTQVSGPSPVVIGLPTEKTTWVKFAGPGTYVLRLTASDTERSASSEVTVTVGAPPGPMPEVSFATTQDGARITKPTPLIGSVSAGAWTVAIALGDEETVGLADFTTISSGTATVSSGTLATLDPTTLLNGAYTVRVTSTTESGTSSASISVVVDKNMKVGTFALAFDDLNVTAPGFTLQVQRTYDSRDKRVGDFGVGWNLAARNVRVEKSVNLGKYWYQWKDSSGFFPEYCIRPQRAGQVSVSLPSGKVYRFEAQAAPSCQTLYPVEFSDMGFKAMAGTVGTLTATDGASVHVAQTGGLPGPAQLQDLSFNIWNPTRFTLTDEDGIRYVIGQKTGIEKIIDLDGNWLQIGPSGLVHSSGQAVKFTRDDKGRITQVTDPSGRVMKYTYDTLGNLATFTNRAGETQSYAYDTQHDLTSLTDARGITPATYSYDSAGRLTTVSDASTGLTQFTHDLGGQREVVTDALGGVTTYEYDDAGNVLKKVDALGKATTYTYDANDNKLTETDPLGNKKSWTYDPWNNLTSETDALGNKTTYTYGPNRKMTSRTDPLGRKTTDGWDYYWNHLLKRTDPAGAVTSYFHEPGIIATVDSTWDPRGALTKSVTSPTGTLLSQTDALGNVTSYTYDSTGNRLTETRKRTKSDGSLETQLTQWTYDAEGRVTKTTYPDGSTTQTAYNKIGKPIETKDQLGRATTYEYDSLGRATKTTFPDGTSESTTYDLLGRKATSTDRAGRTTKFGYDKVGRLLVTTFPDGSTRSSTYDDAGRMMTSTNELGHVTTYDYDAAGRRISVKDALGNTTTMAYDAAGQLVSVTDALSHVTQYAYDLAGRQIKTTYHDGTFEETGYDVAGNRTSKKDQAGVSTAYAYDLLGRLTSVTDVLSNVTSYGYDELGQKVSQTDANLHATKYAYDALGRRVSRTLPLGQVESTIYDVAGRVASKVDFNGKTTRFGYDAADRLITRTPDASFTTESAVSWTYSATGRRLTMVDGTGTTTYTYDTRDRLLSKETPYGTLFYTRDSVGHVKTVRSDASDGVAVDYGWDDDERLSTVTDRGPGTGSGGKVTTYGYDTAGRMTGWVQPNGVATSFTYDDTNHLKNVSVKNAAATTLASYAYTLGTTGNRTGVTEASGRTIAWTYDTLYRLTGETISGAVSANGTVGYTYDAAGNRLSRTSTLSGVPAATSTYDANDRTDADTWNANGNMLTRDGRNQSFDSLDRLMSSSPTSGGTTVKVIYDGDGNRVAVDVGGVVSSYLVDDQNPTGYGQVVEERLSGAVTKAYVFGYRPISQRVRSGSSWTTSHYGMDAHGSVTLLTDSTGSVTDTWEYDAFGTVVARTGTTDNSLTYTGEWLDAAQGLQYLRARWYAPGGGTFVSRDPVEGSREKPSTIQPYTYAANNSVNRIDPSGRSYESEVGVSVHQAICKNFLETGSGRECDITIDTILKEEAEDFPGVSILGIARRPDLIDFTERMVWEIKPLSPDNYLAGYSQLGAYVFFLNLGDPRCALSGYCWERGDDRYTAPMIVATPLSVARVFRPVNGVILYARADLKKIYALVRLLQTAASAGINTFVATSAIQVTSTAGHGVAR